ncbi:helix-turn-helix domain-containing protein [Microbacterium betulae]|uniref:helix-turn-helix domain-containing protein n=1 Tax=Microbacterium betulae TaxID=2981139 RepID=UPI003743AFE3
MGAEAGTRCGLLPPGHPGTGPRRSTLRLAASLDRAARGGARVTDIADRHGLSERTLRRLTDRLFGYGPKTLASIHRFQRVLALVRSGTPLGEASTMAGYVDQSHLTRDVRRLAGTTPADLVV